MSNLAPPKITRLASGSYAIGDWRIMRSTRMGITLWFVWIDGTLTKNVWYDVNTSSFPNLRDAKNHITNMEESKMNTKTAPIEGLTRCECGSKYWDGNRCHSCGDKYPTNMTSQIKTKVDRGQPNRHTDTAPNPNQGEIKMSITVTTTKREEQLQRDETTWETYILLGNWVEVAKQMNYANGSCARRAGMRHALRNGLVVESTASPSAD